MYRPVLRLPNVLLILMLLTCASYAAGPRLRYGEAIRYADQEPKVFADFSLRYTGYTPRIVHTGDGGRDFDFGSYDFDLTSGDTRQTVHWYQGTGAVVPVSFTIGGKDFVLELMMTQTEPVGPRSLIPPDSVLLWKRADFERRVRRQH